MAKNGDTFYDYFRFDDEKVIDIMKGWDGLGGYHGLLVRTMSVLRAYKTVLDVGCGLGHLYEMCKTFSEPPITEYVGVDVDDRVLKVVRERYPHLTFLNRSVYDLSDLGIFDTVFAIGLYRYAPSNQDSVLEMLRHARYCFNTCYYVEPSERGKVLDVFKVPGWEIEFIVHGIDDKLEIIRMWNVTNLGVDMR